MLAIFLVLALIVGGIVAWHAAQDALAARVRGSHRFSPVVAFPDTWTGRILERAALVGKELLWPIGFVRWNDGPVDLFLRRNEFRHLLVLGRSGGGKTAGTQTWLLGLLENARRVGQKVTVLYCTPHLGDAQALLPILAEQHPDLPVGFIDLSGTYGITPWSPFAPRPGMSAEEVANRSVHILGSALGKDLAATPELREVMLSGLYCLLMDDRLTLDMLGDLLLDPDKGKLILPKIQASNIRRFLQRLWGMAEGQRSQIVRHALPKLGMLTASETVRWTLNAAPQSRLDLNAMLTKGGVVLFHPASQKIGDLGNVFTALWIEDVRARLLGRENPGQTPLCVLVIDEVAELLAHGSGGVTETINLLLSGARKANTLVWLCAQDLTGQVSDKRLLSHLLSQTSKAVFQLGRHDAAAFAKELMLPPERPVLWPGDWSCEGARVGGLDPSKFFDESKKDRQDNTYFDLISLPPRSFYLQTPMKTEGFFQMQTRLVYTHDRPDPKDPHALPAFVGMKPCAVARKEAESRRAPWEQSCTPSSPATTPVSSPRRPSPPRPGVPRHAAPANWI